MKKVPPLAINDGKNHAAEPEQDGYTGLQADHLAKIDPSKQRCENSIGGEQDVASPRASPAQRDKQEKITENDAGKLQQNDRREECRRAILISRELFP